MVLRSSDVFQQTPGVHSFAAYRNYSKLSDSRCGWRSQARGKVQFIWPIGHCMLLESLRSVVLDDPVLIAKPFSTSRNESWAPKSEFRQNFAILRWRLRTRRLSTFGSLRNAVAGKQNSAGSDHTHLGWRWRWPDIHPHVNSHEKAEENTEAERAVPRNSHSGKRKSSSCTAAQLLSVARLGLARGESDEASPQRKRQDSVMGEECMPLGDDPEGRAPSPSRVAVIGAGAAGLAVARELVREGQKAVVYEQGEKVGGVWQYDPAVENDLLGVDHGRSRVFGSMYESLRTNIPREVMGFADYPFLPKSGSGRDDRRFPSHQEVARYLEDYSEFYNLTGLVRFGVKVGYVGPESSLKGIDTTRWVVKARKNSGVSRIVEEEAYASDQSRDTVETTEVFDAVVVCSGHFSEARIADIPGVPSWPGVQVHSHNYRSPRPFQDQVVITIGKGPSGEDISTEVAILAKEVHQCVRDWVPSDSSSEGQGLRRNIWQHPMVKRACPDGTVEFEDGTSVLADVILHCTGYLYSFPFLDAKCGIRVEDNRVGPLYKHVFPPAFAPSLSFVGLPFKVLPFPLMEQQARWIAKTISGKLLLPTESEMVAAVRDFYEQLNAEHKRKRDTHNMASYQFEYVDWMAAQNGSEPTDTWRREIYSANTNNRKARPHAYRDEWDDQPWLEIALSLLEKG